jgi:hypothetical protein
MQPRCNPIKITGTAIALQMYRSKEQHICFRKKYKQILYIILSVSMIKRTKEVIPRKATMHLQP